VERVVRRLWISQINLQWWSPAVNVDQAGSFAYGRAGGLCGAVVKLFPLRAGTSAVSRVTNGPGVRAGTRLAGLTRVRKAVAVHGGARDQRSDTPDNS
jgi:hypothetical protein